MNTKVCDYCGKEFIADSRNFKRQRFCSRKDGNSCQKKNWKKENLKRYKKTTRLYNKKRRSDPEYRKKDLAATKAWAMSPNGRYSCYKSGAKERNLSFNLTFEEFMQYWNKKCSYCNCKIDGIGLDRLINSEGYSKENVSPCCITCNNMKKDLDRETFISKCKKIIDND